MMKFVLKYYILCKVKVLLNLEDFTCRDNYVAKRLVFSAAATAAA